MIPVRWYKVFNDLQNNRTRTILIILSIAVGLFAVGTIVSSRSILSKEMNRSFSAINPSSGYLLTVQLFDENFVRAIRDMKGVEEVDKRRAIDVRVQIGPEKWNNLKIYAVEDYNNMLVNKIMPDQGEFPPPTKKILIERSALPVIDKQIGDTITIETPDKKQRQIRIVGSTHDMALAPSQIDNAPYGYISMDTLDWLGEDYGFNELHIVAEEKEDKNKAKNVVNDVKNRVEKNGYTIAMNMTAEPGQLPLNDLLEGILMLMGAVGLLALLMSGFLIINTVSALLAQQKRQIGVMKAIGASSTQIIGMYLSLVLFYGVSALALALPASLIGSRLLCQVMASMFNIDIQQYQIPIEGIWLPILVGILIPIVSSIIPFLFGVRVSAAEAMSADQTYKKGKIGLIDRLLSGANLWFTREVLERPNIFSIRNTFRSKGRLVLTLGTLSLGGAIFVSDFCVRDSILSTMNDMLKLWNFDIMITFTSQYRFDKIKQEALLNPYVEDVDTWFQIPARRKRNDGSDSGMIYLFSPKPESKLVASPTIIEGRWLLPEDENAVVVTSYFFVDEPDLKVGDDVILKIDGKERSFRIVGEAVGLMMSMVYAPYTFVAQITNDIGKGGAALVSVKEEDAHLVSRIADDLGKQYTANKIRVGSIATIEGEMGEMNASFGIILALLIFMAILLALVGGLGLMGTMSINVLERTREIGVLRAIGASNRGVAWVFIREGLAIGLISWAIGSLLAIPLSILLNDALGTLLMGFPLIFSYSVSGALIWLAVVIFLSSLASYLPARDASRLTVREVLAYE